ncbi:ATPase domain-containing protein [Opitutus terrae]|uniref:non-specific serine/threonine protein kinase n=1 Tax=Opitutus terrae (strain DSM 11246 / JCM 15787 / PB90-1) TaxID=452637 RepID=B1ZNF6_OPITP|nr:Non-specific serine/threonine protein kinase [Opitutus terrae PB90-1]
MNGPPARSTTGIVGLDDILNGGFTENRMYLVEGDPGSGKTTLALQYLLEGRKLGEHGLYLTLSESKEELLAGAASHGWSLEGIEIVELNAGEKGLSADENLTMYNPSEVELSETTRAVLESVERTQPRRVVFDSLSEMRLLAQSSLRYRRQILALKQFFVGRRCTVLLLDDGTSEGPDLQLQSIAHGVVTLEQLAPSYGAERRRLRVVKFRGSPYRGGYHDFVIAAGGLQVFPRLIAAEHRSDFPSARLKSGVDRLDLLLGGGLDRGTSSVFMGPAGSGKSTVALRYAIAAADRGEHAVMFVFDESARTLKARGKALGMSFREGTTAGTVSVRQIDPTELAPGEFAHLVREAVAHDHATVVVIDSLNGYLNAMAEERDLTAQLHELLMYLSGQGVCTIMVVAQHGLLGQIAAPIDTTYLADSVVLFCYFEDTGRVRKAISVIKKRSGQHEETIRELRICASGIELSDPLADFQGVLTGVPVKTQPGSPA